MSRGRTERAADPVVAHLAAAQAEAERLLGNGPVTLWRPSSRWRMRAATAAIGAAMLIGGAWWWHAEAPPQRVAAAAQPVPANPSMDDRTFFQAAAPVQAPATLALADRSRCDDEASCGRPAMSGPIAPEWAAALEDPDAWALHPQPWQAVEAPAVARRVNIPPIPDENDATPGEETGPEVDAGAGADE